jgi:glucose/arabinose dehydrogenase
VAEISRVLRYDNVDARLHDPPDPVVVTDDFPTDEHHGWKYIDVGPDDSLYVPVGAPCNICDDSDPYAAIHRLAPDGSGREIVARGVRIPTAVGTASTGTPTPASSGSPTTVATGSATIARPMN